MSYQGIHIYSFTQRHVYMSITTDFLMAIKVISRILLLTATL